MSSLSHCRPLMAHERAEYNTLQTPPQAIGKLALPALPEPPLWPGSVTR